METAVSIGEWTILGLSVAAGVVLFFVARWYELSYEVHRQSVFYRRNSRWKMIERMLKVKYLKWLWISLLFFTVGILGLIRKLLMEIGLGI